jgi:septal ring factor EnvC (AmiA/AmiB activator)
MMPRNMPLRILSAVIILLLALPTHAATETDSRKELQTTMQKLKQSKVKQEQLKSQAKKVEKELRPLKESMVDLAEKIQAQENELSDIDEKITLLETEKNKKLEELSIRRKQLGASLESMIKLSRMPPEAVIAMPGKIENTMRAAQLLGLITQNLQTESESLKGQLAELDGLQKKLAGNYASREAARKKLEDRQRDLGDRITQRTRMQEKLGQDQKRLSQDANELSQKSKTLQDLVENLEKKRRERERLDAQNQPLTSKRGEESTKNKGLRSFVRAKGSIRKPVSGKLTLRFGTSKGQNETSRGVEISARSGASVVAPYDGEVVFTGPFMDYGRMMILRHSDGYHSLIAGFARIDVTPGDIVKQGEPIGVLGTKSASATLYLELRKDSRPIDPAPWIRSL